MLLVMHFVGENLYFNVAKWMRSIMALKARAEMQPFLQKTDTSQTNSNLKKEKGP